MSAVDLPNTPPDLFTRTPQGSWRIATTRVSLDSVITAFWNGSTPEEICQDFPTLSLIQVYSCIAYYLNHREPVDAYLQQQRQAADQLRQTLQTRHQEVLTDLRQRLLAHRESQMTSA